MNQDVFKLLCPFQIRWLRDRSQLAIAEKSRRIGWTWTHGLKVVLDRIDPNQTKSNYYHSSADETAAREFIDYCADWARMCNAVAQVSDAVEVIDDKEIHTRQMVFDRGTKIIAGTSNPNFFRSKGGEVGLDEYAFHRDARQLYKAALATAAFWGYPMRIWSTHDGQGSYFNGLLKSVRAGQLKAQLHRVTVLDAVADGIVERIIMRKKRLAEVPAPDARARQEWLDELRAGCPDEDMWLEEFMCQPSTDAGSLLTYEQIAACEVANLELWADLAGAPAGAMIDAGFDVGRKKDLSVFWGNERIGDVHWCRMLKRFENAPFSVQEDWLNSQLATGKIRRLCIDSTGIGMMLGERLQQRWGKYRVEMVTFTAGTKSAMAMPFVQRFQDRTQRIPMDPRLREALHSVRKIVSAAGNVRLDAEHTEDGHADEFWAGGLACEASDPNNAPLPAPMLSKPEGW